MIGDIDGDGKAEFMAGAYRKETLGVGGIGVVYVFSGTYKASAPNKGVLYTKTGAALDDWFGYSVAGIGDVVDGDGTPDFAVGAPGAESGTLEDAGKVFIYSGFNGGLNRSKAGLHTFDKLGYSVSGGGDMDGDVYSEFIGGAIGHTVDSAGTSYLVGEAYVYGGSGGGQYYRKVGKIGTPIPPVYGDVMGNSVATAGNVDGDAYDDFIIGSYYADTTGGPNDVGFAEVYRGVDGSLKFRLKGQAASDFFGNSVSGAGRIDGDGRDGFIVGAANADSGGISNRGSATVFSGLDASIIFRIWGDSAGDQFGYSVANAGDVDGNGKTDFVVGARYADSSGVDRGAVYLFSGNNAQLLTRRRGSNPSDRMGWSVAGGRDVNGDGKADFIVGAPEASPGGREDAGSVYVIVNCLRKKGDINGDGQFTGADEVALHNCKINPGGPNCNHCWGDMDCDGDIDDADLIIIQEFVYSGTPLPCP